MRNVSGSYSVLMGSVLLLARVCTWGSVVLPIVWWLLLTEITLDECRTTLWKLMKHLSYSSLRESFQSSPERAAALDHPAPLGLLEAPVHHTPVEGVNRRTDVVLDAPEAQATGLDLPLSIKGEPTERGDGIGQLIDLERLDCICHLREDDSLLAGLEAGKVLREVLTWHALLQDPVQSAGLVFPAVPAVDTGNQPCQVILG